MEDLGVWYTWKLMMRDSWIVSRFPKQIQDCLGQRFFCLFVFAPDRCGWVHAFQRIKKMRVHVCYSTISKDSNTLFSYSENKQSCTQNSKSLFAYSGFPFGVFRMQTSHCTASVKVKTDFKQFAVLCQSHVVPMEHDSKMEVTLIYNTFSLLATDFDWPQNLMWFCFLFLPSVHIFHSTVS